MYTSYQLWCMLSSGVCRLGLTVVTEVLYYSVMIQQLINDQKFANIQKAQAGLTRLFADAEKTDSFYTVLKNDEPLGVLLPQRRWESLTEDFEAMSSPNYKKRIAAARKSPRVSAQQIRKLIK